MSDKPHWECTPELPSQKEGGELSYLKFMGKLENNMTRINKWNNFRKEWYRLKTKVI
jgi:hypothetical protein